MPMPTPTPAAPSAIHTQRMTVTPEMATNWIMRQVAGQEKRQSNRRVAAMVQAIKSGHWKETHAAIAIDPLGRLLDGQTRLAAIIESGVPLVLNVTFNVPAASYTAIDQHTRRRIHEVAPEDWITAPVVAVARAMMAGPSWATTLPPDAEDVLDFIRRHERPIREVTDWLGFRHKRAGTRASVAAAIARAWYHADHRRLQSFARLLQSGVVDDPHHDAAVILLRDFLRTPRGRWAGSYGQQLAYAKAQRAIQAFVAGESLTRLYSADDDLYPLPNDGA